MIAAFFVYMALRLSMILKSRPLLTGLDRGPTMITGKDFFNLGA